MSEEEDEELKLSVRLSIPAEGLDVKRMLDADIFLALFAGRCPKLPLL